MAASNEERRVVLVKPGDLLLIGNVGESVDPGSADMLQGMFKALGIRGVIFASDIDLDLLPGGAADG